MSGHRSSRLVPSQQFSVPPGPEMPLHLPYTYSTLGAAIKASLEAMLWTVRAATTPLCCQYCSKVEFTIIVVRTKCRWFPTQQPGGRVCTTPAGQRLDLWLLGGVRVGFKCSLVRGNKRRCAWMALGISPPPSVALLLLSGFTTPTLGCWEPPRPRQTACCRNARALQNSLQTVLLHGFYPMTQFLESCYREFRRYGKQASKSKYSWLLNAIACVIILLHSTNW